MCVCVPSNERVKRFREEIALEGVNMPRISTSPGLFHSLCWSCSFPTGPPSLAVKAGPAAAAAASVVHGGPEVVALLSFLVCAGDLPGGLAASLVHLPERLGHPAFLLQQLVLAVQPQRRLGVLDGVVHL